MNEFIVAGKILAVFECRDFVRIRVEVPDYSGGTTAVLVAAQKVPGLEKAEYIWLRGRTNTVWNAEGKSGLELNASQVEIPAGEIYMNIVRLHGYLGNITETEDGDCTSTVSVYNGMNAIGQKMYKQVAFNAIWEYPRRELQSMKAEAEEAEAQGRRVPMNCYIEAVAAAGPGGQVDSQNILVATRVWRMRSGLEAAEKPAEKPAQRNVPKPAPASSMEPGPVVKAAEKPEQKPSRQEPQKSSQTADVHSGKQGRGAAVQKEKPSAGKPAEKGRSQKAVKSSVRLTIESWRQGSDKDKQTEVTFPSDRNGSVQPVFVNNQPAKASWLR